MHSIKCGTVQSGFTFPTKNSAFLMVLLWVLPGFASLSIVFSAGGEPVIKSDLLFRDLAPAPLRLAVQPVQPTAKSQASKPTDQPGAVESTTQMQSSKSAVQPEAPKKAVTLWSAVEVLAGFTRIFPAPVNFSHNSTVDHLLSPSARTSTEDQLPSTAALVGPGHLRTSRLELTEGGWLCMSLLN
jgi:hypothetical protein